MGTFHFVPHWLIEQAGRNRSLLCLASAALLLTGSTLCTEAETDVITVTDMTGREIVLELPAVQSGENI